MKGLSLLAASSAPGARGVVHVWLFVLSISTSVLYATSSTSTDGISTTVRTCDYSSTYCYGPYPNSGPPKITDCACPPGTLNVSNNCCLSQNWIIGLAAGCGGAAILILLIIIIGMACTQPAASKAVDRQPLTRSAEIINADYVRQQRQTGSDLYTATPAADRTNMAAAVQQKPDFNVTDVNEVRLQNVQGTDLSKDSDPFRTFRPSLQHIDPERDYSIRRPVVDVSSLQSGTPA